jgi:shikimate kinase
MEGRAAALGAGTVLNALATGTGAAFGIDVETRATVTLDPDADDVRGEIAEDPDADTALIERCVALATDRWGDGEGGTVRTDSDVPLAAGLKSSSAAANATVLATLDALDVSVAFWVVFVAFRVVFSVASLTSVAVSVCVAVLVSVGVLVCVCV